MTLILKPDYKELVREIAEHEGLKSYILDIKSSEAQGNLSTMILVTLKSEERNVNLILKVSEPKIHLNLDALSIFKGEIYMYEKLLVKFVEFRKENGARNPGLGVAKYYGHYRNTCFAMENLTAQAFQLRSVTQPLDKDHLILVMKEYGKLHSTSFAMKKKHPELFRELVEGLKSSKVTRTGQDVIKSGLYLKQSMAFALLVSREDAKAFAIVNQLQKVTSRFNNIRTFDRDNHVIVHGDSHCQNMLFKYDDKSNKPTEMKFVDWQMSTLASPVQDLSYFFLLCSSKEDLNEYRNYLKAYHDELSMNLGEMGYGPDEIFPYSQLELHWKECVLFGLWMCLLVHSFICFKKQLHNSDLEDPKFIDQLHEFIPEKPEDFQQSKQRTKELLLFIDREHLV